MHKISLYYSLQDFFGHHGCPPELTPALTFHETLLLYRDALSQVQALIFHSSGTSHLPCNSHIIWLGQTLMHSLSFLARNSPPLFEDVFFFLLKLRYPVLAAFLSSCPSHSRLCSYTLIMATAASPQLISVDGYLPLPHLMISGLYCSRKGIEREESKEKENS